MTKLDQLRNQAQKSVEGYFQEQATAAARLSRNLADVDASMEIPNQLVKAEQDVCAELDEVCVQTISELELQRNAELHALAQQKSELQGEYNLRILQLTEYYDSVGPETKTAIDSQIAGLRLELETKVAQLNAKELETDALYEQQINDYAVKASSAKRGIATTPKVEISKVIGGLAGGDAASQLLSLGSKVGMVDKKTLLLSAGVLASVLLLGAGGAALYNSLTGARVKAPSEYRIGNVIVVGDGLSGNTIEDVARFCAQDPALDGTFSSAAAKAIVEQATDGTLTVDTILNGIESYFVKDASNQ